MRKTTQKVGLFVAAVTVWLSLSSGPKAMAQTIQITGPLAGAPAVRKMRVYRKGRIQLQPFIGFTLQDEYSRTIFFGAQATYHFFDWLGVGFWAGYGGVHIDTDLTDKTVKRGQTTDRNALSLPSNRYFADQIGQLTWAAALQGVFIPLRGKLALFQKLFVDADFYVVLGVAGVGVEERADARVGTGAGEICATAPPADATPANNPCVASQRARSSRVAIAPTFGIGFSFYVNKFMGVTAEWRALPFKWNTSGTDERGGGPGKGFPDGVISSADRIFHFNHMVNLGVAFYLPPSPHISD